jgi:polysaccharide deacetylase 2 family uncharacterized protein YibQ
MIAITTNIGSVESQFGTASDAAMIVQTVRSIHRRIRSRLDALATPARKQGSANAIAKIIEKMSAGVASIAPSIAVGNQTQM